MIKKEIKVVNELGIHARPAGMIANTASCYDSDVKIIKDDIEINAKSIMGVMMLAAGYGTTIQVTADGIDEEAAVRALEDLFLRKFDEE